MHSLTQHGGSSGISKIGRNRDPSYRIITRQGPEALRKEICIICVEV